MFGLIYGGILTAFTVYALLDTFVIPRTYSVASNQASTVGTAYVSGGTVDASSASGTSSGSTSSGSTSSGSTSSGSTSSSATDGSTSSQNAASAGASAASSDPVITDTTYSDGNISITITTYRYEDTNVYAADVTLSSAEYLKRHWRRAATEGILRRKLRRLHRKSMQSWPSTEISTVRRKRDT